MLSQVHPNALFVYWICTLVNSLLIAKAFYMQPLQKVPTDSASPWFTRCPIGVNPLKNMMPNISHLAELSTQYTNHSLRATSATRMFTAGVPEKIIAEHTGHRSTKGLRQYEHISVAQLQAVGMAVSEEKSFCENTGERVAECGVKEEKDTSRVPLQDKLNKTLAAFSGTMTGCTININY